LDQAASRSVRYVQDFENGVHVIYKAEALYDLHTSRETERSAALEIGAGAASIEDNDKLATPKQQSTVIGKLEFALKTAGEDHQVDTSVHAQRRAPIKHVSRKATVVGIRRVTTSYAKSGGSLCRA
jgi:hypothetical protein